MEEKENCKKDEEVLAEIYRNSQLALQSISNILPETKDEDLRNEIQSQHDAYEKISSQACVIARDKGIELKEPNPVKKAMMWGSIKMSTLTDASRGHIAEMMIQGTVMGITALKKTAGEADCTDESICSLLQEFIALEEKFEKKLKTYL